MTIMSLLRTTNDVGKAVMIASLSKKAWGTAWAPPMWMPGLFGPTRRLMCRWAVVLEAGA